MYWVNPMCLHIMHWAGGGVFCFCEYILHNNVTKLQLEKKRAIPNSTLGNGLLFTVAQWWMKWRGGLCLNRSSCQSVIKNWNWFREHSGEETESLMASWETSWGSKICSILCVCVCVSILTCTHTWCMPWLIKGQCPGVRLLPPGSFRGLKSGP